MIRPVRIRSILASKTGTRGGDLRTFYPLSLLEEEQMSIIAPCFGSFSSTTSQNIALAPSVTSFTYDTTDVTAGGVRLDGALPTPSIYVPGTGTYRIITSVQLDKTSGMGPGEGYVWFAINGTAIPNTATKTQINNNTEVVMTVEVLYSAAAGDLISIQSNATNGNERALAEAASSPRPAVPSIITIVQRIK